MSRSYSIAWGLLGGQQCNGTVLDSSTSTEVCSGWDPPRINARSVKQMLSSTESIGNTGVQQLVMGWQHAVLLLADGTAYITDVAAWRGWCADSASR